MDVQVHGAAQLYALRQRLKEAADKDVWKAFVKEVRPLGRPMAARARANALTYLPKRGGYAKEIARSRFTTTARTGLHTAGVRVDAKGNHRLKAVDEGTLRKPLFGDRDYWYDQDVKPGWFSDAAKETGAEARAAADRALADVARKVEGH